LTIAASIVLALIYPGIYWTLDAIESVKKLAIESQYQEIHLQKVDREKQVQYHTQEMEKVKTLVKNEQKSLDDRKNVLTQIHDVKVNYPMKAKAITELTKDLNKYKVKVEEILYQQDNKNKEKSFSLHLLSKKDKRITNLIEWYTKTQSGKYKFTIEKIEFNEDKKVYSSELKVVLK